MSELLELVNVAFENIHHGNSDRLARDLLCFVCGEQVIDGK